MNPASPRSVNGGPLAPAELALLLLTLTVAVACVEDQSAAVGEAYSTWVTEAEFSFGDSPEREVFFTLPEVRADPARGRVFAVDRPNQQVTAWTPDGTLLFQVGKEGEGPGEFIRIGSLHIEMDGTFKVQEDGRGRYTRYTEQGELVGTTPGPPPVSYQGLLVHLHWPAEGSYLGIPSIPDLTASRLKGIAPVTRAPVVRVRDLGDGRWSDPEPLLWMDIGNRTHAVAIPQPGEVDDAIVGSQPFGDPDHVRIEPGAAVMIRSKGRPGTVELIEVDASGDTAWHRLVELTPRRLTSAMVQEVEEREMEFLAQHAPAGTPIARLRRGFYEGLYQPEYLPPTEGPPILTASGEVWMRTTELQDSLRVYYAVPRGDPTGALRRVLLPQAFWITDATATHVWGVQWDSMDRPHVVGRRLLPLPG